MAFGAVQRPTWAAWFLLFNFWAYLVVRVLGTERVPVDLPVSQGAFTRHRRGQKTCAVTLVAGIVIAVVGASTSITAVATAGVGLVIVGFAAGAVLEALTWVGVHYKANDQAIIVTRCHPAFADAVARMRPRSG